jgi:frataxin-like iron-binding protein CyaY
MNIQKIHEEILEKLLQFQELYPSFTFWLRRKKDGLQNGMKFQGTDKYISIGLVATDSGNLSTKSIALQIDISDNKLKGCIILIKRNIQSDEYRDFYLTFSQCLTEIKPGIEWRKELDSSGGIETIFKDLKDFYPIFYSLVEEHKLENKILISQADFSKSLKKVEQFEALLNDPMNTIQTSSQNKILAINYWLFAPGKNANMWEEFLNDGEMGLGWDKLGDLKKFNSRIEIKEALLMSYQGEGSKMNDVSANDDFLNKMQIGDVIIAKKGRSAYLGYGVVNSEYFFDENAKHYKSKRKVSWIKHGVWTAPNADIVLKTLTDITKYPDYVESLRKLIGIEMKEQNIIILNNQKPINQILYGPPGTGKTFKLKDQYFPMYTTKETSLSSEQHFKNVVSECSWWQVIAIALIQTRKSKVSDLINNKWIIQKAALSNSNNIRPTIWGQLQSHTVDECEFVNVKSKQHPYIFNKTKDSYWEILEEEVKEKVPELYEIIDSCENFKPNPEIKIQRYVFTTFHQSYSYEDFIEGIKPIMIEGEVDSNVTYHIEDGIFKQLCKKAEMDKENRYAIFIDEINRGNVSAIFGELITLIEQDKRKNASNAMSALLPYSKKQFSVPQNVDIYGTMNTADRSVEALDTALRRRFSFEEMLPKPELLKDKGENKSGKVGEINLEELLKTINERIEALVDRDHTIGHAFFMEVDSLDSLRNVFANKVIPLLQEYFYGDYAKMEMVIGPDFFNSEKRKKKVTFAIQNENVEISTGNFELMNILEPTFNFDSAINRLLNRKVIEVEVN